MHVRIASLVMSVQLVVAFSSAAYAQVCTNNGSIRVINASSDAGTIDLVVNGQRVVSGIQSGAASGFTGLNSGLIRFQVNAGGKDTILISPVDLTVSPNARQTVVLVGRTAGSGQSRNSTLRTIVISDETTAPATGQAKIRILNTNSSSDPVDVFIGDTRIASNVAFGVVSNFIEVPAGRVAIKVNAAGTTTTLAGPTQLDLVAGRVYTLTTESLATDRSLSANLIVDRTFDAQARIVHASPNAGAIDLIVDGRPVVTNLTFPNSSPYVTLPSGPACLAVAATGSSVPALTPISLDLASASRQTIVVAGVTSGTPALQTFVFSDTTAEPAKDKAKLRIIHAAAETVAADVLVGDQKLVSNLEFGKATDFLEVTPGTLSIRVNAAGTSTSFVGPTEITLSAGQVATLIVRGRASDSTLGVTLLIGSSAA